MSEQAQRHQQGAAPHEGQALPCTSVGLPMGRGFESVLQGRVPRSTGSPLLAVQHARPTQPCKLPLLNSAHTLVEGELFARYTVSARRVSYESVFKYVTGSINRDLL